MKLEDIDRRIGLAIKALRIKKGLTQHEVAEKQNISYQQVQKYENGKSSIQVKRLYSICRSFNVSIEEFLKEAFEQYALAEPEAEYMAGKDLNIIVTKEELHLVKLFRKIKSKKLKEGLFKLIMGLEEEIS